MATKRKATTKTGKTAVSEAAKIPVKDRPTKRIAIVGCSDSKDAAPYSDNSWEIWAMNNAYTHVTRRNAWFELHPIKLENGKFFRRKLITPGVFKYSPEFRGAEMRHYMEELAALDIPVYMQKKWDIIPKSIAYPLDEVKKTFGTYFTNSVSYMIAMAILQGATEIGCYGVDMATGCPAPDVKILSGDLRWVRADSLQPGDEVIGFDENPADGAGHSRRWRKSTVTSCPTLKKPCYRLKLEDGTELIVSENHGWLTHAENENRWRRQKNMVSRYHRKDRPSRIVRLLDTWDTDSTRPPRLLDRFDAGLLGQLNRKSAPAIVESEFIGDHDVVGLETTSKTFIAEGLASHNSEYGPQRPSCEFFLGVAAGMGIKITIPPAADLLKTKFLYGFGEREQVAWEEKMTAIKASLAARKAKAMNARAMAEQQSQQYIGAEAALQEIERTWSNLLTTTEWNPSQQP